MAVGRNEKCPCGSGKKYKNCCLQKDLEAQKHQEPVEEPFEENPVPGFATWKLFLIITAILGAIALFIAFVLDFPRAAGSFFGCGMLVLIVYSAFRNEPTVRKNPGDAGNIDFGNRQGIQPVKKNK